MPIERRTGGGRTTLREHEPRFMRRRRRVRHRGLSFSVNIAPMIDLSFLLLTFFLVTTTFQAWIRDGPVDQPMARRRRESTLTDRSF